MKRIALLGVALFCVLVAYFALSLDRRVARAIEQSASESFGTPVRVGGVSLSLREGRGTIRGLRVANPEGFSDADAIRFGDIELEISVASLGAQPVRVESARIGASQVRFEVTRSGDSNIAHFVHHLADHAGDDASGASEPQRYTVDTLRFEGGDILFVRVDRGGEDDRIDLPDLKMRGVGGAEGATGDALSEEIARAFTRRVLAATAGHQVGRAVGDSLGEAAGEVAEGLLRGILD